MEIENLTKEIRARAFERKDPKTPSQVAASWYNDDLTYDGVAKTLFICWYNDVFLSYYVIMAYVSLLATFDVL